MTYRPDAMVLGAGIVGLSSALQLQAQGLSVALIDRRDAGAETSYGNAGIIERATLYPYAFPRQLSTLLQYASNQNIQARYHFSYLPQLLPWLARYWWHSEPNRHAQIMLASKPLIELCLREHMQLIEAAGAQNLISHCGWIKFARSDQGIAALEAEWQSLQGFGLQINQLDRAALSALEPKLSAQAVYALHFRDPVSVRDPFALSQAYLKLFLQRGGRFLHGDAMTLQESDHRWDVTTESGLCSSARVVVALGPWAQSLLARFGYRFPLAFKRGYHQHFAYQDAAPLHHTVLDVEQGYLLAPMQQGIRLTTGVEFAHRDAAPTPIQITRCAERAQKTFPLGQAIEKQAWMGSRPCLPDMLPIIGPAPRHAGLWLNFGHQHKGLTLGPVTGLLLAQMMVGAEPFTDPAPYRASRFQSA